jgi:undecaprenyl-phosphate 4-deoxy-4-formamido-L-arabinose transferase
MAGFETARGEIIVTLDADLQNPPEEIPKLIAEMDAGHDVVGSYRRDRQDSLFRTLPSRLVNLVRERITGIKMRDQGCMLRAYRRNIVRIIVESGETSTFIPALAQFYAERPSEVEVEHAARHAGTSNYNLYKLIRLNFDLMTGFSLVPLQLFTMVGMGVSGASLLLVVYMLLRRIFIGPEVEGIFTLFAILFFLLGVVITGLGIVGEYVGRIYQQVRARARFRIRTIHEKT